MKRGFVIGFALSIAAVFSGVGRAQHVALVQLPLCVLAQTPSPPDPVAATPVQFPLQVRLDWAASTNAIYFYVMRSENNRDFSTVVKLRASARSAFDATVAPSRRYYYKVRAEASSGKTTDSKVVQAFTDRAPEDYTIPAGDARNTVIDGFNVATNARYKYDGNYKCNLFVSDVTKAFGSEVPLYLVQNGTTYWLNANAQQDWLLNQGPQKGWFELPDARTAQGYANRGYAVVLSYKNPTGDHGHISVARAFGWNGGFNPANGPMTANAGGTNNNFNAGTALKGFGPTLSQVRYFAHQ